MNREPNHAKPDDLLAKRRLVSRALAFLIAIALGVAVLLLPAHGGAPLPEWVLFFGRFHPVILHLPIGLFLLLPILHLIARFCPPGSLRPALVAVLWLCAGSTVAATIAGMILSQEPGYSGATLALHRQVALSLCGLSVLLLLCEAGGDSPTVARAGFAAWARQGYRVSLTLALGALGVASHLGGDLTHGATFLTEHLHALRGPAASTPSKPGAQENTYANAIAPILEARCVSCHGADKAKGGLRLNTMDAILAGGNSQREEHKASVVPGKADESLLIQSIVTAENDDGHMPPAGKAQLTPAEIATLRAWIDAGAAGAPALPSTAANGHSGSS